ncbi:DUF998 domain-containing protein [Hoyosella rhizosphaerae]|uniref:DUF998 domain-containing protein n=1 Tax=Hoyosella rhizosphaerae TaxID=1755582 RepID=A0A916X9Z9_9ACTN|nr:DUF998 domain-containing protein [Hoyosella rhizosphaerae]MBN4926998.1 DUF998 domain-containing protein [Hoyosella rhizosphaerae]GGC54853.1 hypothetical protein GCM10011410_04040 [Hoyosella rhizosphaerae]
MPRTGVRERRHTRLTTAGVLFVLAAVWYLGSEAIAAAAFAGYSYSHNYISDLGIPGLGTSGGRDIDSPLALVMNVGFVGHGILFVAAAYLLVTALPATRLRWVYFGFAVVHGVGITMVGIFPAALDASDTNGMVLHVIGAGMAIVGGNLAVITGGFIVLRRVVPPWVPSASVALGMTGLVCLAMLMLSQNAGSSILVAHGVWERGAVYTVQAWELLVAAVILVGAVRQSPAGASTSRSSRW